MIGIIVFFILFIIIDLLFYIPILIHILIADDLVGVYIFSIPIFYVTPQKTINHLRNKISIENLKYADKEDMKYIESIAIEEIHINTTFIDPSHEYSYIWYPLLGIFADLNTNIFKNKMTIEHNQQKKYHFYLKMHVKIARVIKYYFIIRRLKHERTSN